MTINLSEGEISALKYIDKHGTMEGWLPAYGSYTYTILVNKLLIYRQEVSPNKVYLSPQAIDALKEHSMEARIKDFIAWLRDKEMEIVRCGDNDYVYLSKTDDDLIADYREQTAQ